MGKITRSAFYITPGRHCGTMAGARQIQGKELSYNNLAMPRRPGGSF